MNRFSLILLCFLVACTSDDYEGFFSSDIPGVYYGKVGLTTETDSVGILIPTTATISQNGEGYSLNIDESGQIEIPEIYIEMWLEAPDYGYFDIIKPTYFESNGLNLIRLKDNRGVTISFWYEHRYSADSTYQIRFGGKK